jgi:CysZ protein
MNEKYLASIPEIIFSSVGSLFQGQILKFTLYSAFISGFLVVLLMIGCGIVISSFDFGFSMFGINFADGLVDTFVFITSAMIAMMIYPLLIPIISGLFADKIADIIALRYDSTPPIDDPRATIDDIKFVLKALGLNIVFIPLYLIPLLNLFAFPALNAYLLGKEYYILCARRRIGREAANESFQKNRKTIFMLGLLLVILAFVPVANIFAPVFAVSLFAHTFHNIGNS